MSITSISTGSCPAEWREWWRTNGTPWHDIAELHVAVINRLLIAGSSS